MAKYRIDHTDGQITYMSCDLTQAASTIYAGFGEGDDPEYAPTPFSAADARHRRECAAALVLHYTDRESCAEDAAHGCDCARRVKRISEL